MEVVFDFIWRMYQRSFIILKHQQKVFIMQLVIQQQTHWTSNIQVLDKVVQLKYTVIYNLNKSSLSPRHIHYVNYWVKSFLLFIAASFSLFNAFNDVIIWFYPLFVQMQLSYIYLSIYTIYIIYVGTQNQSHSM